MTFGARLKQARLDKRYTLRALCNFYHLVLSHQSQIERDLQPPPDNAKYHAVYAELFDLQVNSPDWGQFLDELAIARKQIPADLSLDARLPAIFSGLRTTESLDTFLEFLQREK